MRSNRHRIEVPVTCYLIEHPKGNILFDTGFDKSVEGIKYDMPGFMRKNKVAVPNVPTGYTIDNRLKALGFKSKDIDYVILSHLDGDHAGGLHMVKNAKNIIVSESELKAAKKISVRYNSKFWKDTLIKPFTFKNSPIGPENKAFDLFEDGSIILVHTPGHSKGLTSILVNSLIDNKYIVLAGDVGDVRMNWEKLILPGIIDNKAKALSSLKWLQGISYNENCKGIFVNHDPEIVKREIDL
ncbi:N-acyl homoserine lactonase family protein [Staphylococcus cohnii]|uniref:N-acyl homoserine lactonase family protein n=1 Tax=Staphylococcus cohnii TaxID=29382 RepID=UPI003D7E6BCD